MSLKQRLPVPHVLRVVPERPDRVGRLRGHRGHVRGHRPEGRLELVTSTVKIVLVPRGSTTFPLLFQPLSRLLGHVGREL